MKNPGSSCHGTESKKKWARPLKQQFMSVLDEEKKWEIKNKKTFKEGFTGYIVYSLLRVHHARILTSISVKGNQGDAVAQIPENEELGENWLRSVLLSLLKRLS